MKTLLAGFMILVALLLGGCSGGEPDWQTTDITGVMPPLQFTLSDENGREVTAEDYRGKATLMFFGFTSCPDVCPLTLSRLANALEPLSPEERDEVQVLFVSVDPQRDSPEDLAEYTEFFGPEFVGLTGTQAQLRALNMRYRATYGYGEPDEDGFYSVSHSSAVYGFAPDGEIRIMIRDRHSTEAVTADIRQLLEAG